MSINERDRDRLSGRRRWSIHKEHFLVVLTIALGSLVSGACAEAGAGTAAGPASPPEPVCPSGSAWNGANCVRTLVVTEVSCPAGSLWDGARCVASAETQCPAGARFVHGEGCVADIAEGPDAAFPGQATFPPPPATSPSTPAAGAVSPQPPAGACACKAGDLMCAMKCSAACKDRPMLSCMSGGSPGAPAAPPAPSPPARDKEFDKAAAARALSAASASAKGCPGVAGTGRILVVFAPSGRVRSSILQGGPLVGTPQGGCIAAVFRGAVIPPFDGSDVSVTKSFTVP